MVEHDEALDELWRIKEEISLRYDSIHAIAVEARRIAKVEPLGVPGKHRKRIEGFAHVGLVGDPDPILEEIWRTKDTLAKRFGNDLHRLAEHFRREEANAKPVQLRSNRKRISSQGSFRTTKGKAANKQNEKH